MNLVAKNGLNNRIWTMRQNCIAVRFDAFVSFLLKSITVNIVFDKNKSSAIEIIFELSCYLTTDIKQTNKV